MMAGRIESLLLLAITFWLSSNSCLYSQHAKLEAMVIEENDQFQIRLNLPFPQIPAASRKVGGLQLRATTFANMSTRGEWADEGYASSTALFLYQTEKGIHVEQIKSSNQPELTNRQGLLIWSDRGKEHWQLINPSRQHASADRLSDQTNSPISTVSREAANSVGVQSVAISDSTNPLEQLSGMLLVRADAAPPRLVAPISDQWCLNQKLTLRRASKSDGSFPKDSITIWKGSLGSKNPRAKSSSLLSLKDNPPWLGTTFPLCPTRSKTDYLKAPIPLPVTKAMKASTALKWPRMASMST